VIALQYVEDGVGTEAMNLELAGLAVAILEEDPEAGFDEIAEAWKVRAADMTPGDSAQVDALTRETRPGLGMFISQPFLRDLLIFDAGAALKASSCPVLALGGEFDPMKVTLPSIRAALESRSESNYRVKLLPEINHMFQTAPDMGSPPEWAALEETFSPSALELLTNWVQEYTQGP